MSFRDRLREDAAMILAGGGSVAISAAAIAREPVVNNDGARYLAAAEAYSRAGLGAATHIYPWPFYSVLIGVLSEVTPSPLVAAHLLDTTLLAVASVALVAIVRELGGDRRTHLVAAFLVLTHPAITHLRAVVARDFGLWAFLMLGVLALLRFGANGRRRHALAWAACGAAAVLFRPEALAMWSVASLAPLFDPSIPRAEKTRRVALLALFPVVAAGLLATAFALARVRRALPPPTFLLGALTGGFRSGAQALAVAFPYPHGREYAPYILLWGLTLVPPVKLVRAMGVAQSALSAIGAARAPGTTWARRALGLAAAGAAVPLLVLLPTRLFLETRYAIPCSLLLLAFAPFGLDSLVRKEDSPRARLLGRLAAASIALVWGFDIMGARDERGHLMAAGQWLDQHAPAIARVHTNSPQIAYYSRRSVDWNEVEASLLGAPVAGGSGPAEYVALVVAGTERFPAPSRSDAPAVSFAGNGERVVIYFSRARP